MTIDEMKNAKVTLNGQDAVIIGFRRQYGIVSTLGGVQVKYSWGAIERIIAAGGHFKF